MWVSLVASENIIVEGVSATLKLDDIRARRGRYRRASASAACASGRTLSTPTRGRCRWSRCGEPELDPATHYLRRAGGDARVRGAARRDQFRLGLLSEAAQARRGCRATSPSPQPEGRVRAPRAVERGASLRALTLGGLRSRSSAQEPEREPPAVGWSSWGCSRRRSTILASSSRRSTGAVSGAGRRGGRPAERLVGILTEMPFYQDEPFYKRAQLTAADLAMARRGAVRRSGPADDLCRQPRAARAAHGRGADYDPDVLARIEREELIAAGSTGGARDPGRARCTPSSSSASTQLRERHRSARRPCSSTIAVESWPAAGVQGHPATSRANGVLLSPCRVYSLRS